MNFRTHVPEEPRLNLTPLIDIVFLLLIFFMVSTTFDRNGELVIELPDVQQQASLDEASMTIAINAQGQYFFNDKMISPPQELQLRQLLTAEAKKNTTTTVQVRADGRASHQSVVTVMDLLGQTGFNKITVATTKSIKQDQ